MAVIKMTLKPGMKPSDEQLARIKAAADRPITFDEDCPEMTEEDLSNFKPVDPEARKRWLSERNAL